MDSTTLYPLDYPALARQALQGGFTIGLDGQTPTSGYAVSDRPDAERVIQIWSHRGMLADVADALYHYVIEFGHELRTTHKLGAWRDGDRVVIDLVRVLDSASDAIQTAVENHQDAIYDIANARDIRDLGALYVPGKDAR